MTTPDPDPANDSIIDAFHGFAWSSEESVAYEAAIEAINGAVGAYTARLTAEEAAPEPDTAAIAAWREARAECARRREALDPADHTQIAQTRRHYTALAQQIREHAA